MIVEKIKIGEIIGSRYDNSYVRYRHKAGSYKYPVVALRDLLIDKPQYGSGEAGVPRTNHNLPRYIRITDIDEYGLLSDDFGVTASKIESKFFLNEDDILIARSGNTVGKSYIHKKKVVNESCLYAGYLIRFVIDPKKVLPEYVYVFTKLSPFTEWIKVTQRITGQPNINAEEYGSLSIPIPPIAIQQEICKIYLKALRERQCNLSKAKQKLDWINDYLLDVLDIDSNGNDVTSLGEVRVNKISMVIGKRLDVSFYKGRFEMRSSKYPNYELSALVDMDATISFRSLDKDMLVSFIPMECIDEKYGEIAECRETTISNTKGYTKFRENDLLWAKISPCMQNGKSAIARNLKNGFGCGSTEYFVLRPKNEEAILIDYIYLLLRHKELLKAAQSALGGTAGQQRVSMEYLKSKLIPVPEISIQKEIVKTVSAAKKYAKQLEAEGDTLIDDAKRRIEQLIMK